MKEKTAINANRSMLNSELNKDGNLISGLESSIFIQENNTYIGVTTLASDDLFNSNFVVSGYSSSNLPTCFPSFDLGTGVIKSDAHLCNSFLTDYRNPELIIDNSISLRVARLQSCDLNGSISVNCDYSTSSSSAVFPNFDLGKGVVRTDSYSGNKFLSDFRSSELIHNNYTDLALTSSLSSSFNFSTSVNGNYSASSSLVVFPNFDFRNGVVKADTFSSKGFLSDLNSFALIPDIYPSLGPSSTLETNDFLKLLPDYRNCLESISPRLLSDNGNLQSVRNDSLYSTNQHLSGMVSSLTIPNIYEGIGVPDTPTRSEFDSLTAINIYSPGRSPLNIKGIDFGQSVVKTDLYSINNYLSVTESVIFPNKSYSNIGLNKVSSLGNDFSFVRNINEVIPSDAVTYFNNPVITSNQFESRRLGLMSEIEKKFKDFLQTIKLDKNHFGLEFTADKYNFHLNINITNCTINSNQIQFGNKYIN